MSNKNTILQAIEYTKTLPKNGTGYYSLYVGIQNGVWFVGNVSHYIGTNDKTLQERIDKSYFPVTSYQSIKKVLEKYEEPILKELNEKMPLL